MLPYDDTKIQLSPLFFLNMLKKGKMAPVVIKNTIFTLSSVSLKWRRNTSFSQYILLFRHHINGRQWTPEMKADDLDIHQWFQSNSLFDNQCILGMYQHTYKSINCMFFLMLNYLFLWFLSPVFHFKTIENKRLLYKILHNQNPKSFDIQLLYEYFPLDVVYLCP